MIGHSTRVASCLITALFGLFACAAGTPTAPTRPGPTTSAKPVAAPQSQPVLPNAKIEVEKAPDRVQLNGPLGTAIYSPTEQEKPFFEKTPANELEIGSVVTESGYDLASHRGKWISWFGIVRAVHKLDDGYELLVEHKYFDGLTDTHILALSFNGTGDFKVLVHGSKTEIHPLELIRVYGTVIDEKPRTKTATVPAEYIRVFPWKTFTFLSCYGRDQTNPAWRKQCSLPFEGVWNLPVDWFVWHIVTLNPIYDPVPDETYYRIRLGDPAEVVEWPSEEKPK